MEYLVQLITQPSAVVVFVAIILIVAAWPLYLATVKIGQVSRDVRNATDLLLNLGKDKQLEFYNQFKEVHGQIVKIPVLRHTWRQFVDSMYFEAATAPDEYKKAYISQRPSHYFHRDSVLGSQLNLSQFFSYPNYLIGIGLTFTFIGLAAALHVAQEGLASGAGQQALQDLLAVASIKFISSIAGIVCSLFVSALQRVRVRAFQNDLSIFCDLLEECTKYKSTEKLLHDSFNELRRNTLALENMGQNIADGIGEQLSVSITKGLEPLTTDIRSLAQKFSQGSEAALSNMLDTFIGELRKSSNDEMQGLMASAQTLQGSLNQLAVHMDSAGKDFDARTKSSVEKLDIAINNLSTSFGPVDARLAQSLQKVEETSTNFKVAGDGIVGAVDAFKRSENAFSQHIQTLVSSNHNASEMTAALEQASRRLDSVATSLDSLDKQFGKSMENLGGALGKLGASGPSESPSVKSKLPWWKN